MTEIRQLCAHDVQTRGEALARLMHTCTDISFSGHIPQGFYQEKLESLRSWLSQGKACLLGAFREDCLAGFLWGYVLRDPLGGKFHIAYFAVLPEYEGLGIGSQLMEAARDQALGLGITRLELMVSGDNTRALDFYRNQDFRVRRYVLAKDLTCSSAGKGGLDTQ